MSPSILCLFWNLSAINLVWKLTDGNNELTNKFQFCPNFIFKYSYLLLTYVHFYFCCFVLSRARFIFLLFPSLLRSFSSVLLSFLSPFLPFSFPSFSFSFPLSSIYLLTFFLLCNPILYFFFVPFLSFFFGGGEPGGHVPPQILGAPRCPPPPHKSHAYIIVFLFAIYGACVNTFCPHKNHAYVFLKYALRYAYLIVFMPFYPPPPCDKSDDFFFLLVRLFRRKIRSPF